MLDNTRLIKKLVGGFLGVAGASTLIGFPGLAQANFHSSLSNSSESILAQTPAGSTSPTPSTTSAPGTIDTTPSGGATSAPGTVDTTPSGGATSTPETNNSRSSLSTADRDFITKAAQSDNTEIQTSKLALKRSQNQQVRNFAQRMIQDHTNSTNQLKQIVQPKGIKLPSGVGSNKALVTKLTNLTGKNFDRAYMQAQVEAHTKTLNDYQNYLKQGQNAELQAFATKIEPVVEQHLQMAQNMGSRM